MLGVLLIVSPGRAASNVVEQLTGGPSKVAADPTERELHAVMLADDAAQEEVGRWLSTNTIPRTNALAQAEFNRRIVERYSGVQQGYEQFLRNHPNHARGYLAYGSFLNDTGNEEAAKTQYENARQLDPQNPAGWNNLANYYGENGGVTKAFEYYAQAIKLKPDEPVYYQNFATTVYLFRKDARDYFHLDEPQVFDKALGLYRQALRFAPDDLVLATDYAESFYAIKPLRTNDALVAWTNALQIAHTDLERQGVELHLARVKIMAGQFCQAQAHLDTLTHADYADLKQQLQLSLARHKNPATNAEPEVPPSPAVTPISPTNRQ